MISYTCAKWHTSVTKAAFRVLFCHTPVSPPERLLTVQGVKQPLPSSTASIQKPQEINTNIVKILSMSDSVAKFQEPELIIFA